MQRDENTPTKQITVQGLSLSVIQPFTEGHVITKEESNVLNQTLAENLRNNFASQLKRLAGEAEQKLEVFVQSKSIEEIQQLMDDYIKAYEFGARMASSGRTATIVDPVEKRAMEIAKSKIKEILKKKGYKISTVSAAQLNALAQQLLDRTPAILEEARRQVEAAKEVAEDSLDDIESLLKETPPEEAQAQAESKPKGKKKKAA